MIKISTTEETIVREKTVVVCDLCGDEAPNGEWVSARGAYTSFTVQLECKEFTNLPGCGYTGVAYDCCPDCFEEKVQPALEALGLKPRDTAG